MCQKRIMHIWVGLYMWENRYRQFKDKKRTVNVGKEVRTKKWDRTCGKMFPQKFQIVDAKISLYLMKTLILSSLGCGNYCREETIQGRKLFGKGRYAWYGLTAIFTIQPQRFCGSCKEFIFNQGCL